MDVAVVGRHTKVSEDFRNHVVEKLRKIESLDPRVHRVEVHVVHERNPRLAAESERLEITVYGVGTVVRAEAAADDRATALDLVIDRLVERFRKQHERRAKRHKGAVSIGEIAAAVARVGEHADEPQSVRVWEGAPASAVRDIPLDGTPITIRSKTHIGSPMAIADAIDQMELVGHDFFLFHDVESGLPSAVYRRRGWTYGVIHLERGEGEEARATA